MLKVNPMSRVKGRESESFRIDNKRVYIEECASSHSVGQLWKEEVN